MRGRDLLQKLLHHLGAKASLKLPTYALIHSLGQALENRPFKYVLQGLTKQLSNLARMPLSLNQRPRRSGKSVVHSRTTDGVRWVSGR